jgi:hypothetical protein
MDDGLGACLKRTMAHLSIAAHFSLDASIIAARRSRRHRFLENFIENAATIRFPVPRRE